MNNTKEVEARLKEIISSILKSEIGWGLFPPNSNGNSSDYWRLKIGSKGGSMPCWYDIPSTSEQELFKWADLFKKHLSQYRYNFVKIDE